MEGKTIKGKYEIIELISENPVAKVYRAKHLGLNHTIAVKVMNPALIKNDKTFAQRFSENAQLLKNLNHQ
ncbi:MAG: serine/threonine-protein kinase, partial [bacterium]